MFAHIALFGLALMPVSDTRHPAPSNSRPRVEVWTTRGDDPYSRGQGVRVFLRADQDAYVTLFRVDTDGRVRVLFPREPWEDNFVRGDREFEVQGYASRDLFQIDDYPGVGYLFAVAAPDPFVYDAIESGDHWDYRGIADGRVRGDPYVALTDLAQRIVPADYTDWDYDIIPYYVQQHYDYPRFLCYDCHTFATWPSWNPYTYTCVRFRVVVYDDPYYYPYRYGGRRAVFTRPFRPEPRFVFKDRDGAGDDRFVTRVRERPVNDDTRRRVGGRDPGGVTVPTPPSLPPRERPTRPTDDGQDRGRRGRPEQPQQPQPDRPDRPDDHGRRDRPDRPDHPDRPGDARPQIAPPREQPRPQIAPPREQPRPQPRAEPRRQPPPAVAPPRAEPRRDPPPPPKDKGKPAEPRRRRP
jgi:hypothetical protein